MTPQKSGLAGAGRESGPQRDIDHEERRRAGRAIVAISVMIVFVTLLHMFTPARSLPLHMLYRRLYFVPIIYAAWVFGRRGGLITGVISAVLYGAHVSLMLGGSVSRFDTWLEMISFVALGLLFGALRDIEVRRSSDLQQVSSQLEEAYKKLEERAIQLINVQDYTASILRSITSGVLTVGPDGSIATANPAAERMLGMTETQMVPRPIEILFREDGGIASDVAKVLSGRVPMAHREATFVTPIGRVVHAQVSTSRMRAVGGSILGAVVTLEDVSDIRTLTDQLIRADRLAAMGELTAGVAHEVRNPLGVIRASVQLLEDAQCDKERIHVAAGVIKQEIDRLDRVIKALLDFGRPSKPTLVDTDLAGVLEDVVLFTSRFAKQASVHISYARPEGLPPVYGDPDQLKQVFLNLVTNAVQAMDEEGGNIGIFAESDGDYVVVTVADTGPGIADEDITKVFDPFFTKRADGTGLGLTIVHRIIDEHDGHIEVESSERGTTFTVSMPAVFKE
ncbi:MAG: ATP-binding protein [Coriobacteriia bacterium]|nr:ATP-binding protein [Coriobacteriia bacterium]